MMSTFPNFNSDEFKYKSDHKCKECIHILCIEYRSGKRFYYCEVTVDNKTHCKLKKIRLRDMACNKFKSEEFS